jgi:hypothetical protein
MKHTKLILAAIFFLISADCRAQCKFDSASAMSYRYRGLLFLVLKPYLSGDSIDVSKSEDLYLLSDDCVADAPFKPKNRFWFALNNQGENLYFYDALTIQVIKTASGQNDTDTKKLSAYRNVNPWYRGISPFYYTNRDDLKHTTLTDFNKAHLTGTFGDRDKAFQGEFHASPSPRGILTDSDPSWWAVAENSTAGATRVLVENSEYRFRRNSPATEAAQGVPFAVRFSTWDKIILKMKTHDQGDSITYDFDMKNRDFSVQE